MPNIEQYKNWCLQAIALTFLNVFAIVYDSEWLQIAVGTDLIMLGVQLKATYDTKKVVTVE